MSAGGRPTILVAEPQARSGVGRDSGPGGQRVPLSGGERDIDRNRAVHGPVNPWIHLHAFEVAALRKPLAHLHDVAGVVRLAFPVGRQTLDQRRVERDSLDTQASECKASSRPVDELDAGASRRHVNCESPRDECSFEIAARGGVAFNGAPGLLVHAVIEHVTDGGAQRVEIRGEFPVLTSDAFQAHVHRRDQDRLSGRHRNGGMPAIVALAQRDGDRCRLVVAERAQPFARLVGRPFDESIHPPPRRVARLPGERQARAHIAGCNAMDSVDSDAHGARRRVLGARSIEFEHTLGSIAHAGASAGQGRGREDERDHRVERARAHAHAPAPAFVDGPDKKLVQLAHEGRASWRHRPRRAQAHDRSRRRDGASTSFRHGIQLPRCELVHGSRRPSANLFDPCHRQADVARLQVHIALREGDFNPVLEEPIPETEQHLTDDVGAALLRVVDPEPNLEVHRAVAESLEQATRLRG